MSLKPGRDGKSPDVDDLNGNPRAKHDPAGCRTIGLVPPLLENSQATGVSAEKHSVSPVSDLEHPVDGLPDPAASRSDCDVSLEAGLLLHDQILLLDLEDDLPHVIFHGDHEAGEAENCRMPTLEALHPGAEPVTMVTAEACWGPGIIDIPLPPDVGWPCPDPAIAASPGSRGRAGGMALLYRADQGAGRQGAELAMCTSSGTQAPHNPSLRDHDYHKEHVGDVESVVNELSLMGRNMMNYSGFAQYTQSPPRSCMTRQLESGSHTVAQTSKLVWGSELFQMSTGTQVTFACSGHAGTAPQRQQREPKLDHSREITSTQTMSISPEEPTCNAQNILVEVSRDETTSHFAEYFSNLPAEVVQKIFSFLTHQELSSSIAHVCRQWYDLAMDPIHWQSLVLPNSPKLGSDNFIKVISRCPLLKSLNLVYRDTLLVEELQHVAWKCPLLVDLDLGFCDVIDETYIAVLATAMPQLVRLNLEGCIGVNHKSVEWLCRLGSLQDLNLSHCDRLDSEGVQILAEKLNGLQHLNIDGIPDVKHSAVATLCRNAEKRLRSLHVDGAELDDESVAAMSRCRGLDCLRISFADLLTDSCLGFVQTLTNLTSLTIKKGLNLSSDGLSALFRAKTLCNLTHLNLAECSKLEDDGVFAIVDCCGKGLYHLHLCWCWNVTDAGLEAIVNNCSNLETLDILGINLVFGECLAHIPHRLPRLRQLDLTQCNKIKDNIIVQLVKDNPKLVAKNYYGDNFAP